MRGGAGGGLCGGPAVDEPVEFVLEVGEADGLGDRDPVTWATTIGPAGTEFLRPVTVEFGVHPAHLEGAGLNDVTILRSAGDRGPWEPLPTTVSGQWVGALTMHLSVFVGVIERGRQR